jgi:hypothetical protein
MATADCGAALSSKNAAVSMHNAGLIGEATVQLAAENPSHP